MDSQSRLSIKKALLLGNNGTPKKSADSIMRIGRKSRVLGRPKETNGAKEKDHAATALATTS